MTAAWPASVNQKWIGGSYSEQSERNVASFGPEVGPPMERPRSDITTDLVQFSGRGTRAEWLALKEFYGTALRQGVAPFTRTSPTTCATATYKFRSAPKLTNIFGGKYFWSLELRLMPS